MQQINLYIGNIKGNRVDYLNLVWYMVRTLRDFVYHITRHGITRKLHVFFIYDICKRELVIIQIHDLFELQESLDMTSMGKLSMMLIPLHNLIQILRRVCTVT